MLSNVLMSIAPTGDAGVPGVLQFNTATGTQSFTLAAGSYAGTLSGGPLDGAVGWTLIRQGDSGVTQVPAVLLDPQPYNFTITPGVTTNLSLHFEVAAVGTVTFGSGTLTTNLGVEAGSLPPGHMQVVSTASFPQTTYSSGNMALDSLLAIPAAGTGSIPFTVSLTLTSPFVLGVDQACASATATVTGTALPDAGTEDVYAAWFQEVNGASGQVCVYDAMSASGSTIQMVLNRTGTANTPAFQSALGMAAPTFQISMSQMTVPPYLVNGVLSLGSLNTPVQLPIGYLYLSISGANLFAQARTGGQPSTLQVAP
jgi:hypothetical protein